MVHRKQQILLKKIGSLLSVVRGYNIVIIVLAQYLAAIFILAPERNIFKVVFDFNLFILIFCSSLTIASGYIINNFYDRQKDLINRPTKSMMDRWVSQNTKLKVYFVSNLVVAFIALLISWRAFLFFSGYIFLIWLYSHKLKKIPFVGNVTASLLAILPFFAILLYFYTKFSLDEIIRYQQQLLLIMAHASFLFLLLLVREIIKDLENLKGDLANNYKTIPIVYGEVFSKKIITLLCFLCLYPIYILVEDFEIGAMDNYFYVCILALTGLVVYLWYATKKRQFLLLHSLLKLLIVAGVFSIVLVQ